MIKTCSSIFRRFDQLTISKRHPIIKILPKLQSSPAVNCYTTHATKIMRTDEDISKVFLDLEKLDKNLYRSRHLLSGFASSGPVYGGQVIGQALVAALETVPNEFHVHSLHCYFIRAGNVKSPILYQVDPVRDGRSFCTRCVKAIQDGEAIYTCMLSFHKDEAPIIEHQCTMPDVKPPEKCRTIREILEEVLRSPNLDEKAKKNVTSRLSALPLTFEIRPVDDECFVRRKPLKPKLIFWVKAAGSIGNDHRLHHCVGAYISDTGMIGAALLPHPEVPLSAGLTLSLDHAIWFHRSQFAIDDWMLYETESDIASSGRAFIRGRMWSKDGQLMFSTAQEGLVRVSKM